MTSSSDQPTGSYRPRSEQDTGATNATPGFTAATPSYAGPYSGYDPTQPVAPKPSGSQRTVDWFKQSLTVPVMWLVAAVLLGSGVVLGFWLDSDQPSTANAATAAALLEPEALSTSIGMVHEINPEPWKNSYQVRTECGDFDVTELDMTGAGIEEYELVSVTLMDDGSTVLKSVEDTWSSDCSGRYGPRN